MGGSQRPAQPNRRAPINATKATLLRMPIARALTDLREHYEVHQQQVNRGCGALRPQRRANREEVAPERARWVRPGAQAAGAPRRETRALCGRAAPRKHESPP